MCEFDASSKVGKPERNSRLDQLREAVFLDLCLVLMYLYKDFKLNLVVDGEGWNSLFKGEAFFPFGKVLACIPSFFRDLKTKILQIAGAQEHVIAIVSSNVDQTVKIGPSPRPKKKSVKEENTNSLYFEDLQERSYVFIEDIIEGNRIIPAKQVLRDG